MTQPWPLVRFQLGPLGWGKRKAVQGEALSVAFPTVERGTAARSYGHGRGTSPPSQPPVPSQFLGKPCASTRPAASLTTRIMARKTIITRGCSRRSELFAINVEDIEEAAEGLRISAAARPTRKGTDTSSPFRGG
jgi:hypothetical protein